MRWKELTGKEVLFESELTHSNVIYPLPEKGGQDKVVKNEKSVLRRAEKKQGIETRSLVVQ